MIALRLFGTFMGGLASHVFHKPTRHLGPRWGSLARYAVGSLMLIPFRLLVYSGLGEIKRENERIAITDLLTLVAFGAGVLTGHLMDRHDTE